MLLLLPAVEATSSAFLFASENLMAFRWRLLGD